MQATATADLNCGEAYLSPKEAVTLAAEVLGGQEALSDLLNVTPGFVSQMATGFRPVPPKRAREIEQATDGAIPKEFLCPDVFGVLDAAKTSAFAIKLSKEIKRLYPHKSLPR